MWFCSSAYYTRTHSTHTHYTETDNVETYSATYTNYEFMSCYTCRGLLYLR